MVECDIKLTTVTTWPNHPFSCWQLLLLRYKKHIRSPHCSVCMYQLRYSLSVEKNVIHQVYNIIILLLLSWRNYFVRVLAATTISRHLFLSNVLYPSSFQYPSLTGLLLQPAIFSYVCLVVSSLEVL